MKAKTAKATKSTSDDFVDDDVVSSGAASYFKPEQGDNKIRVISKPITGWLQWEDKVPTRTPLADGEPETLDEDNPPKKFMAMAIIDYADNQVKIWEITQQSIIKAIKAYSGNEDWGNPFTYDLNINKKGESLKTKYTVTPSPKKPLSKELVKAAQAKPCNLEALYEGEDPWSETEENVTEYHLK